jgi:hypothetical protein
MIEIMKAQQAFEPVIQYVPILLKLIGSILILIRKETSFEHKSNTPIEPIRQNNFRLQSKVEINLQVGEYSSPKNETDKIG